MAVNFDQVDAMLQGLGALNNVVADAFEAKHHLGTSVQTGPTGSPFSVLNAMNNSAKVVGSNHDTPHL